MMVTLPLWILIPGNLSFQNLHGKELLIVMGTLIYL